MVAAGAKCSAPAAGSLATIRSKRKRLTTYGPFFVSACCGYFTLKVSDPVALRSPCTVTVTIHSPLPRVHLSLNRTLA